MTDDVVARVAILAPMPSELKPLVKRLSLREERRGDLVVHVGRAGDVEVLAVTSGMGLTNAARATERLLDAAVVDHVVVSGIAGGIAPNVAIGDAIVPEVVVDEASGNEYRPHTLGDTTPHGRLLSSDTFFSSAEDLARFHAQGVIALDMETSGVAEVCQRRGQPWSVFRFISDLGGETDPEMYALAKPDGSANVKALARYLVTRPQRIPYLVKVGRNSVNAADAAAEAAIAAARLVRPAQRGNT